MATCPRGTNLDPQSGYCISQCSPGYVYMTGDCVQQCPPNMNMNDQKICIRPTFSRSMFVNDNPSQKSFIVFGLENNSVTYGAFSNETKNIEFDQPISVSGPVKQVLPQNNNSFWLIEDQRQSNEDQESFSTPVQTFTGTLGNSFENVNPVVTAATGQSLVPEIRKAVYMPTRDQMLTISDSTPSQVQLYNVNGNNISNGSVVYDENQMTLDEILFFTGASPTLDVSGSITTEGRAQKGSIKANNVLGTSYFEYTTSIQSRNGGGFVISGKPNELNFDYVVFQDPDTTVHKVSNGHTVTSEVIRVDQHDSNDKTRYLLVSGDTTDEPVNVFSYVEETTSTLTNVPITDVYSTEVVTSTYDPLSNIALFSMDNPSNPSVVTYTYTYDTVTSSTLDPAKYGTATSMEIVNMANQPKDWTYGTLTIPANCSNIHVIMWGAGGSADDEPINTGTGGAGAFVEGDIDPTKWAPGQTMRILVGAGGLQDTYNFPINPFGNGGAGSEATSVGQGGGLARIQVTTNSSVPSPTWYDVIVGSGGGSTGNGIGGASGQIGATGSNLYNGTSGSDETNKNPNSNPYSGQGGSQTAGGLAGSGPQGSAQNGLQYQGGDTLIDSTSLGYAGGGSGYYGGGGASNVGYGAGGGSSYVSNLNQKSMNFQPGDNYKAPMSNHPLYVPGIAKGGQAQTGNGIGFPEGGNALIIVQFTIKASSPVTPGTDTFGRNVVYTTTSSWMFDMTPSSALLKNNLEIVTFENKPPAGVVHSIAIFSTKTGITPNGMIVMAMEMTADQWLSTSGYSQNVFVQYEGLVYQAITDIEPNSDAPPDALDTLWHVASSTQLYYAPFTFDDTTITIANNNFSILPQNENPMSSIVKVSMIPSSQPTFVFMGTGVRIARFQTGNTTGNTVNSDWQWSTGLVKNIPDFDTSFMVTDGAYESQRGVFTIAARPKMVNVTTTIQNDYIAQFEDTNACKYATDGNNIIVAIGGPLLMPDGSSIPQSDFQIRYTATNGIYKNIPELYYQGNRVLMSSQPIDMNNLLRSSSNPGPVFMDDINALLNGLPQPTTFKLRSPANILVSTDKGKHFKPIKDGTNRSKISPYVYTIFEGYNDANGKTDVVPLNGATPVIMKSQFNDITYLPLNKKSGYFIAVGSYVWDINTFASSTLPNGNATGHGTVLGPNVLWICSSSEPELWYPKYFNVTNKSNQSSDNFWNVLSCRYDETAKQIFLATDFAMYTFDDLDVEASLTTDTLNVQMLAFLPPYGAVCFERDAENQCIACPSGSYNEIINISRTNTTPVPTNVCLYASNIEIANETANIYNGFPDTGIQQFTQSVTYFQLTSESMLAALWGSGGGNPNQDITLNSGASGAYISAIINRDAITTKYSTSIASPYLICVIDYGKVSSSSMNTTLYGVGGGLSGIFWDPQNGSNQNTTSPNLQYPILIAGGGGGGGSKVSQSVGGYGGVTVGGDASESGGIGANNSNHDNNFSVSQMLSQLGSNSNGASSGAGFIAGVAGTNGLGGGGGTCYIDLDICNPLESDDGNSVENYGGPIAFPGGLSSPLYVLPAGQTGQKGTISYILQDGLNTFYVPLQGGLEFIGLCPAKYTVFSPTNDEELFCRLDECLTSQKRDANGNYIGNSDSTLWWSNSFSSDGANSVMQICLQNALAATYTTGIQAFPKAIARPDLPSQTAVLPSYQSDTNPNQEHTITTVTWQKSALYPKNDKSNSDAIDKLYDENNIPNWTDGVLESNDATNFGYVLVSKATQKRFVAPGVGNICISDIQSTIDTYLSVKNYINTFNAFLSDGTISKLAGYLPTNYHPLNPVVSQYTAPNDYLRSFINSLKYPQSVLTVPFTLKNYTNIDTNVKRLMSTNFMRPRNWAFNFTYISDGITPQLIDNNFPEGTTDIPQYTLVSDQPDENDNNEFLYPDPMNVWSTINASDPYKCMIVAPARAAYYTHTISGSTLIPGATTAWFGGLPSPNVLYGLSTATKSSVAYGTNFSNHSAFHYFMANDVYTTVPKIGATSNSCTLNIFLNVSKLLDNASFDWTLVDDTQSIGTNAYSIAGDDSSKTLLKRLLGIQVTSGAWVDPEFDPMYHFVFTDPTGTTNTLINGTPQSNQVTLATIHHILYGSTEAAGPSTSAYCVPVQNSVYSNNPNLIGNDVNPAVLMYAKRVMVANITDSTIYNTAWEVNQQNFTNEVFDYTTYTVPVVASNNATRTAFLWFVVNIKFPSPVTPLITLGTTTLSSELWNNKNQIVNASVPTISVENVWENSQEIAQIRPQISTATLAESGPQLSLFQAQPLVLTRYFQDRFQIFDEYYTENDPYRGMPVQVPYYNPHQIFPRATENTYQGNVAMSIVSSSTQIIRLMDPEFFYVGDNFANFMGDRPCTLSDGFNLAGYHFPPLLGVYDTYDNNSILILGMAPRMLTTITNNNDGTVDSWLRNNNTNMNVTVPARYNALLVENDTNDDGIRVYFNQSALVYRFKLLPNFGGGGGLYETMDFSPDGNPSDPKSAVTPPQTPFWFYTPCVAASFVVHPLDNPALDNDTYNNDNDYMYMVLENPAIRSTSDPYYWAFHVVQTKTISATTYYGRIYEVPPSGSGNWIQQNKNITNINAGVSNSIQTYNGGGYYSFQGSTATDKKYWLTNNPADNVTLPDPSLDATRMQLITSYQAEYISDTFTAEKPLPRVLKFPKPQTTYLWNANTASFAWESQHVGSENSQLSGLWIKIDGFGLTQGIIDFSDTNTFPDDGSRAQFMMGLLQNSINNNNMKIAESSDSTPDPGSNTAGVNKINIDIVPGTVNGKQVWYLQLTVSIYSANDIQTYYDDISIDVRSLDPITRQILGLSRANKLFLEYPVPYQVFGSYQTGSQYIATFPDPMFFGPFSDTMIMLSPVIKDPTKSINPEKNLVPMDDNGTWIKAEKAAKNNNQSGFKLKFYRSEYDLPTAAVIANMTYSSFSGQANPNLVADIDNLFSVSKSYYNSGAYTGSYPADTGTPLTNQLTLQSKYNIPTSTVLPYMSTLSNGQSIPTYIDPLGTSYTYFDVQQQQQVTIGPSGSPDTYAGDSFLMYRTANNLTNQQVISYASGPVNANIDTDFKLPNYNGLDILNTKAFPTVSGAAPDSEGYTFENFYWIYWPWINSTTYSNNINYIEGRGTVPEYNNPARPTNTIDFGIAPGGFNAWWYPTSLNRIGETAYSNAQILSACSSKTLLSIDSALMGSSDGLLRVAFMKGGLVGKVSQISSALTFSKQTVPLNIGPIVQIFQLGVHWFVYSSLNGPYTTYGQRNAETDLVNVNLAALKFGPLFDASGAAFNNTTFNYWSTPMQQDKNTFSPVLFMRKIMVGSKEVLLMGDIYDNLVGVFYQGPKLAYACLITSSVSGSNLGTTSIIDAILVDNGLQVAITNPQKTITGTSSTAAKVLQQIIDARALWTTQKSKKPGMVPVSTVQSNTFTITSTLVLPDPALGFTNNAEALLEDFGQQMTNDIAAGLDIRDTTGYSIGGTYPFDDLNNPLTTYSWANVITINAYHTDVVGSALSQPFSARFDFTIDDPHDRIVPVAIPGQPGQYTVGLSLSFDFVARNFFNMLNNAPTYSQELICTTTGPATGYIVTNDIAPIGGSSDQNEPKWYRDAFMSFKCKHIRYGSTFTIRPQYFYSDYPKNMFSDMIVTKANEVDANVYISDIVYSPETDVAIWIPIGRYAAIPVRMQYNYTTNGFYSPYDSTTAPKFLSNAIVAWNPNTYKFYLAGFGVKNGTRKLWVVSNLVNAGSTNGSTIAPPDNFIEETWTLGGITNTLTNYFTGITCMDFSTTCEAIAGYLTTSTETVTVVYYKLANSIWQPAQFRQKGLVTAMKFVGFGWYIATWDPDVNNGHNIAKGLSSLWFASANFTVIAYVDAWNTVDRLSYVNSIDYATQLLKGTCPTGFEPSLEDPNVCYKICPTGYDAFGTTCVLTCPPGYATSSIANQCVPNKYTPNKIQPQKRMVRDAEPVNTNVTEFTAVVPRQTNTGNAAKLAVIVPVAAGILGATLFSLFTK